MWELSFCGVCLNDVEEVLFFELVGFEVINFEVVSGDNVKVMFNILDFCCLGEYVV